MLCGDPCVAGLEGPGPVPLAAHHQRVQHAEAHRGNHVRGHQGGPGGRGGWGGRGRGVWGSGGVGEWGGGVCGIWWMLDAICYRLYSI
jgi:hypothetical protein